MSTITVTLTAEQAALLAKAGHRMANILRDEPAFMFPARFSSADEYRRFLMAEARRLDKAAAVIEAAV